jgi:hypothetical protein
MATEPRLRDHLIKLFDLYANHTGLSVMTIGGRFYGDGRFYGNLKAGSSFQVRAYDRLVAEFHHIWPAAIEWPADIEPVRLDQLPAPRRKRTISA